MAKRFFYVCAGLLMLALAYHFGAASAGAQAGSTPIAVWGAAGDDSYVLVMTSGGDVFQRRHSPNGWYPMEGIGNFWSGGIPTPAQTTTFGAIKAKFRR